MLFDCNLDETIPPSSTDPDTALTVHEKINQVGSDAMGKLVTELFAGMVFERRRFAVLVDLGNRWNDMARAFVETNAQLGVPMS